MLVLAKRRRDIERRRQAPGAGAGHQEAVVLAVVIGVADHHIEGHTPEQLLAIGARIGAHMQPEQVSDRHIGRPGLRRNLIVVGGLVPHGARAEVMQRPIWRPVEPSDQSACLLTHRAQLYLGRADSAQACQFHCGALDPGQVDCVFPGSEFGDPLDLAGRNGNLGVHAAERGAELHQLPQVAP